jgi:uncharacterized protein YecA (UPF0149 family)
MEILQTKSKLENIMTKEDQILAEFKAKLEALLAEYPDVVLDSVYDCGDVKALMKSSETGYYASVDISY